MNLSRRCLVRLPLALLMALSAHCLCSCGSGEMRAGESPFEERWFTVMLRGRRVGYMRTSAGRTQAGGREAVSLASRTVMSFRHAGGDIHVVSESATLYSADGPNELISHRSSSSSGDSKSSVWIERDESGYTVEIRRAGLVEKKRAAFRHTLSDAMAPIGFRSPGHGERSPCVVFLPELPAEEDAFVSAEAAPGGAVRVTTRSPSMRRFALFDASGGEIARGFGQGIRYERTSRAEACRPGYRGNLSELSVSAVMDRPLGFPAAQAGMLTIVIDGADPADFPSDGRQLVEALNDSSARLTVVRNGSAMADAAAAGDLSEFLVNDGILPCDHPEIRALAQKAAGTGAPLERAGSIVRWVHSNLARAGRVHMVSALQVAREMRGDCTEHALLAAAMCRASGVPARLAVGIVYCGDETRSFAFHSWIEVWADGWKAMDPAWGQCSADATHVKLADGSNPYGLLPFLCDLKIRLESAEADR